MMPTNQRRKRANDASKGKSTEQYSTKKFGRNSTKHSGQKDKPIECMGKVNNNSMHVNEETNQVHELNKKLKLQLFPINSITRAGLEKDGHNPHLELILKGTKKISSVVKHLTSKWGNSRIAIGELMLFPYDAAPKHASVCIPWSLESTSTNAADIYRAMGCPPILRLRYGWFSDEQFKEVDQEQDKLSSMLVVGNNDGPCLETYQELAVDGGDLPHPLPNNTSPADTDRNGKDGMKINEAAILWADGLSNISFKDLLAKTSVICSEESPSTQLPVQSSFPISQMSFASDTFDAAIAAQLSKMQSSNQAKIVPPPSILDAEETCHAFPFQKSLPKYGILQSSGHALAPFVQDAPPSKITDMGDKPFCGIGSSTEERGLPIFQPQEECEAAPGISSQSEFPEMAAGCNEVTIDIASQATDQKFCENSMGLASINWESLGSMDVCLPSKTVTSATESIGFGNLLSSTCDGFRSPFRNSDKSNSSSLKLHLQGK